MVIAIDGPAGAGKSTVARAVAAELGFTYLDSGAMYRSLALAALRAGVDPSDAEALERLASGSQIRFDGGRVELDGEDVSEAIRRPEVSDAASQVAVHPQVRDVLVGLQRETVREGGWVAEGRDIGTVVVPDSPLKVFLEASDGERARRRALQDGDEVAAVLAAQGARDGRDSGREAGALVAADDAVYLDTTELDAAGVTARIVALARERGLGAGVGE